MKTNQLVFLFACVLSVTIYWQQSALAAEELLPKISFEKTVCDLGDVGQGGKNTCEFRFTNTGRGLLKIGKINRTCGCTVFQLDKKEYAPNEIIHSFRPAYKRPFLWPCGRRQVSVSKACFQNRACREHQSWLKQISANQR
ncbi:MAG: DUF1573 domain-containing protein [Planctomycetota bacterium]|jgi:hypothetical protein